MYNGHEQSGLVLGWLNLTITQIFNALVQVLQAAYHALASKQPNDSSNRQTKNGNEENNKFLASFSEDHSVFLFVYQKLQAYLSGCHVNFVC